MKSKHLKPFKNIEHRNQLINTLGYKVSNLQLENLIIMPISVVSTILLNNRRGISFNELMVQAE